MAAVRMHAGLLRRLAGRAASAAAAPHGPVAPGARLLVVYLAAIGDGVMLSPFLRELRRGLPGATIHLVVQPATASLHAHCPHVDAILPFDADVRRLLRPFILPVRAWRFARRALRGPYDVVLMPRWETDHYYATSISLFSGAPRRVGYSEHETPPKRVMNAGFDRLLTDVVRYDGPTGSHEVTRLLHLLTAVGLSVHDDALALWLSPADDAAADVLLAGAPTGRFLVALSIAGAFARRRWPTERYARVAARLVDEGVTVLIIGGVAERAAQAELLDQLDATRRERVVPLAGVTSLRETAALIGRCDLFVGNDSGPAHFAAAMRVPVVEVFGFSRAGRPDRLDSPVRFGPWGTTALILQPEASLPPCDGACTSEDTHCIRQVATESVIQGCLSMLAGPAAGHRRVVG